MAASAALFVIAFFCLAVGWVGAALWVAFAAAAVLLLWSVAVVSELIFSPPRHR